MLYSGHRPGSGVKHGVRTTPGREDMDHVRKDNTIGYVPGTLEIRIPGFRRDLNKDLDGYSIEVILVHTSLPVSDSFLRLKTYK